jgi:hypothetical protein
MMRMTPKPGQWGVSGVVLDAGEWAPDGCRPIAWRNTKDEAEKVAVTLRPAPDASMFVAQVLSAPGGFTLGPYHEVPAVLDA